MRTLGIDPGTATTGWGVVDEINKKPVLVEYGVIKTSKHDPMSERLNVISHELKLLFDKFKPDSVAVEKLFFSSNVTTAIKVGEARGVILLTAGTNGITPFEYTPLQVKMALTGYGLADKKQIQYMVKNILGLKEVPKPDDAADAIAIAVCHINSWRIGKIK